jgi:hypothetical protein
LEAEEASAEESEDVDTHDLGKDLGMVFSLGFLYFYECDVDDFLDDEDGESEDYIGGELNTHGVPNDPIRILAEFDAEEAHVLAEQLRQKYHKSLKRAVDSSGESEAESGESEAESDDSNSCDDTPETVGQSMSDDVEMDALGQDRRQAKAARGKMTDQRKRQTTEKEKKMYKVDKTFSEALEMGDSLRENPFLKIAWCIPSQPEYQPKLKNSLDKSSLVPCGFEIWSQRLTISDMEMWSIRVPVSI